MQGQLSRLQEWAEQGRKNSVSRGHIAGFWQREDIPVVEGGHVNKQPDNRLATESSSIHCPITGDGPLFTTQVSQCTTWRKFEQAMSI